MIRFLYIRKTVQKWKSYVDNGKVIKDQLITLHHHCIWISNYKKMVSLKLKSNKVGIPSFMFMKVKLSINMVKKQWIFLNYTFVSLKSQKLTTRSIQFQVKMEQRFWLLGDNLSMNLWFRKLTLSWTVMNRYSKLFWISNKLKMDLSIGKTGHPKYENSPMGKLLRNCDLRLKYF